MAGPGGPQAVITDTAAGTVSIVDLISHTAVMTIDAVARAAGPRDASRPCRRRPASRRCRAAARFPSPVTFDGTKSTDRDGAIVSYTFTFGDGTSVSSPVPIVTHTYTAVGKFTAGLVVTDDDGASSAAVLTSVQGGGQQAAQGRAEGERDDRESPVPRDVRCLPVE